MVSDVVSIWGHICEPRQDLHYNTGQKSKGELSSEPVSSSLRVQTGSIILSRQDENAVDFPYGFAVEKSSAANRHQILQILVQFFVDFGVDCVFKKTQKDWARFTKIV